MRKYELVCIFDPQVGEGHFDGLVETYENHLKAQGGDVANIDRWGMRQLAYCTTSMRNRRQGYYVLYQFEAEPGIIQPLEEELRIDENVLRYLVTLVEGEFLRVPELLPESQIIFGPPQQRDRDRGRGRSDRDRGRGRDEAAPGRRPSPSRDGQDREGQSESNGDGAADSVGVASVEDSAVGAEGEQNTEE